jgi:hypothetical protein
LAKLIISRKSLAVNCICQLAAFCFAGGVEFHKQTERGIGKMCLETQVIPQVMVVAGQPDTIEALKGLRERWERSAGENVCRIMLTGQLALLDVMEALGVPIEMYDQVLGKTPPATTPLGPRPQYFIAKY